MPQFNLRQARVFLEVATQGSITKAAAVLNRSQTSVTKTVKEFESGLGHELFRRSSRGVVLTACGKAFHPKAAAAKREFEAAEALVPPVLFESSPRIKHFFRMDVSDKWLDAFVATVDTRSVAAAARHLSITTAAVSASLRKLEDFLGMTLFERTAATHEPTAFSRAVVRHIKIARNYMRQGLEEISNIEGVVHGRVVVGTLPFVRTFLLPAAIIQIQKEHPQLDIATTESPYADLITGLRCGDVDFLLGALRGSDASDDMVEEPLLYDDLSVVVRAAHPLAGKKTVNWPDLLHFNWVLPRRGTPTRDLVHTLMSSNGFKEPDHVVETSSFVILRGLLMDSDCVTVLSRHQCVREIRAGLLACLDICLPGTERAIGITTRANCDLSPAALLLADAVRNIVKSSACL